MNAKVEAHIGRSDRWQHEMIALRATLLRCGLTEDIKWGKLCYSHDGKNIVIMQQMKDFLALMFFKGALLSDPEGVLIEQGPNSRSALRLEFTSTADVARLSETVIAYIREAIDIEEQGLEVAPAPALVLVEQLQQRLDQDGALRVAFEALTPGRQREYNLYVSGATRDATRLALIDRCATRILAGKGLRDR